MRNARSQKTRELILCDAWGPVKDASGRSVSSFTGDMRERKLDRFWERKGLEPKLPVSFVSALRELCVR